MGFFDRLFVGKVVKEWELHRNSLGIGTATISLILAKRGKKSRIAIRKRESALLSFGVNYADLPIECLPRLRDAAIEACQLAEANPLG